MFFWPYFDFLWQFRSVDCFRELEEERHVIVTISLWYKMHSLWPRAWTTTLILFLSSIIDPRHWHDNDNDNDTDNDGDDNDGDDDDDDDNDDDDYVGCEED